MAGRYFDILTKFLVGYSTPAVGQTETTLCASRENRHSRIGGKEPDSWLLGSRDEKDLEESMGKHSQFSHHWKLDAVAQDRKVRKRGRVQWGCTRDQMWTLAGSAEASTVPIWHQEAARKLLWDLWMPSSIDKHPSSATCLRCPSLQGACPGETLACIPNLCSASFSCSLRERFLSAT